MKLTRWQKQMRQWQEGVATFDWDEIERAVEEAKRAKNPNGGRFTRKGDKRPTWEVEKKMAAYRRNRAAKLRHSVGGERVRAAGREKFYAKREYQEALRAKLLELMRPGEWYGAGDLARSLSEDYQDRRKRLALVTAALKGLHKRGAIAMVENPEWTGPIQRDERGLVSAEPRWLWGVRAPVLS